MTPLEIIGAVLLSALALKAAIEYVDGFNEKMKMKRIASLKKQLRNIEQQASEAELRANLIRASLAVANAR